MQCRLAIPNFMQISVVKAIIYVGRVCMCLRTFHIYCPTLVKLGTREMHLTLLRILKLRENRRREGRNFVIGVNEITRHGERHLE
jgi:hypothetical protein